jgi:Ca2+/Na+ antiporter
MGFLKGFAAFLDYRYWTNPTPVPLGPTLVGGIFAFFAWFVIIGIASFAVTRTTFRQEKLVAGIFRRFSRLFVVTGLLGLLLLFLAYEQIPYLGMRLWLLPLVAYFFIKLGFIVAYIVRDYPRERDEMAERAKLERYSVQPKHR